MKVTKCLIAVVLILLLYSCEKEETISIAEMLQNEKGWYAYEYKRVELGQDEDFRIGQPYIIIGEYGSGLKIKDDGVCHINYSDGSEPIIEGTIKKYWSLDDNDNIIFSSLTSETIMAKIMEISAEDLWIKYEQAGDNWEYKLKKIE